jgi:hypothetical protein
VTGSLTLLALALAGTGLILIGLRFYLAWRGRQKNPAELERARRLHLNRIGRIVDGRVIELLDASNGPLPRLVVYRYRVRGVEYQAAQDISFLGVQATRLDLRRVASGQSISVKYDPQNPSNSIILSEVWSGL